MKKLTDLYDQGNFDGKLIAQMIEKLRECESIGLTTKQIINSLNDLLMSYADGKLIILPCKLGQTVWYAFEYDELDGTVVKGVDSVILTGYIKDKDGLEFYAVQEKCGDDDFIPVDKMYLTKEEAERALEVEETQEVHNEI